MDYTDRERYKPRADICPQCSVHYSPMIVDPAVWGDPAKREITPFYHCRIEGCELQWDQRHGYFVLGNTGILHSNEDIAKLNKCSNIGHGYLFIENCQVHGTAETWACSVKQCNVRIEKYPEAIPIGWEPKCRIDPQCRRATEQARYPN
jgi:hypothetical protein